MASRFGVKEDLLAVGAEGGDRLPSFRRDQPLGEAFGGVLS